ncbi:phosphatidate phosphatase PAH2 [Acrasis kona]|uniref:Phosphatidate phosphatase PAH2 n=1 Tax=Acrasis kona TaxID=1008807 RepID=A0AAW2Z660_9EUKA
MSSVDIIAIKHYDGTIRTSPFYVRFRRRVLKKSQIKIQINGDATDIENFCIDAGDKHARFVWDNKLIHWEGEFWPVYQTWELQAEASMTNEKKREYYTSMMDRLLPRTETIKKLNLKEGVNVVNFILGEGRVATSRIYFWSCDQRIVVSDVDGTITGKGENFSRFSKFYTNHFYVKRIRPSIIELYKSIEDNGYKVIYVTGRPVRQYAVIKKLLLDIRQEDDENNTMPEGPIFTTPYKFYISRAFKVRCGRPDQFKTSMLTRIKMLYPEHINEPIVAGFGNTSTDIMSYKKSGVNPSMCFFVNKDHSVASDRKNFKNYAHIKEAVHEMFPKHDR